MNQGAGGCSANCFCDVRKQQPVGVDFQYGICNVAFSCGASCQSDGDCPSGQACAAGAAIAVCPGGSSCVDYSPCSSSLGLGKRQVLVRGSEEEKAARMARSNVLSKSAAGIRRL
jgi:hypothetical protein